MRLEWRIEGKKRKTETEMGGLRDERFGRGGGEISGKWERGFGGDGSEMGLVMKKKVKQKSTTGVGDNLTPDRCRVDHGCCCDSESPMVCPMSPMVCLMSPMVCPMSPMVCPMSPMVCPMSPMVCPMMFLGFVFIARVLVSVMVNNSNPSIIA